MRKVLICQGTISKITDTKFIASNIEGKELLSDKSMDLLERKIGSLYRLAITEKNVEVIFSEWGDLDRKTVAKFNVLTIGRKRKAVA